MQEWEREFHVNRIVAGKCRIKIGTTVLYLTAPTRQQRFAATEIYREARRDAELDGALSEQELLNILLENRIWTIKDEEEKTKLTKAVEDLKVGLFENRLRSNARTTIRKALQKTRDELQRLDGIRHCLDYVTIDGLALSARFRFIIGSCLLYEDGGPYFYNGQWDNADPFIDNVVDIISSNRLSEIEFRELARNDPWRSIWSTKSHVGRGVFDCAAVDLTDDQKNLMLWAGIYDSVREHPECPTDEIIDYDDMLDGWMILQRRKRETHQATTLADSIGQTGNKKMREKLRNSDEVFIMTETVDDAREVEKLNDLAASVTKKQRMNYLKEKGEVNEVHMPDTAKKIQMELNRLEAVKMRQAANRKG